MSQGFNKKTRVEIVEDMKSRARNLFGQGVNLAVNSPLGIIIQLTSWPLSLLWSALEKIYNAYYILTATGQDLDNLAKNIGITRILAAKATGEVEFTGDEGVSIPEGFLVETDSDPEIQFETTGETTIDETLTTTVEIIAVEAGSSSNVSANTITEIVNPISGLDSVSNNDPTSGGRDRENDTQFRRRYLDSLDRPGGSTTNSIRANVLEETEATACIVLENITPEENEEGLPPKSFEVIALGGTAANIAIAIFDEKKPAGIEPFGSEIETIIDDSGQEQDVGFSFADSIDVYCNVEIDIDADYPSDGDNQIKDEIISYIGGIDTDGNSISGLSIAEDVVRSRIISFMYNVDGVNDVLEVELGIESNNLNPENVLIGLREAARTEPDFIDVIT